MPGSIKKIGIPSATIAASALLLMAPMLAAAASPHFIKTPQITKNSNLSLTASFKAAGLANLPTGAFLTSSGGTAELQCVNPGGNNPPPKLVDFGPLQGQTTNIQPRNGQITASATIGPPSLPGPSEICPNPNWSVQIVSLTYEDVVLHIQQNGGDILTFNFGNVDP
jgi:hypothetical protein